jgi:uncharacterized protein (DUF433 family)
MDNRVERCERLGEDKPDSDDPGQLLADFPGLSKTDLIAAWEYYRDHTEEIDQTGD